MSKKSRDEFSTKTVLQIAKRAGWLCSFPSCRAHTVGATADGQGEINIGTAAHICAASPGGPRYDEHMSEDERSSANNGIWMCRDHGKAIDDDELQFTVTNLREWKKQAESESCQRVLRDEIAAHAPAAITDASLIARLRSATEQDLAVFKRSGKWPSTSVALTVEVEGLGEPVSTDALARMVTSLDDLILVAGPGMGKTTTLFQIAEGLLAHAGGIPLVVLLNDWATQSSDILEAILKRPAFRGITKDDFYKAAAQQGFVLMLDGWNEMDDKARNLARVQVHALQNELPELGLVVSTRKPRNQALDIPFGGKRVDLLPLSETQQMKIAKEIRGEDGAQQVDQAWRTPGVRDLMTIPLYLKALLSLPKGTPFPTTKEEVLRHFVTAHEKDTTRATALHAVVQDFQQDYLGALAVFATQTASTAIADGNARRSISDTAAFLGGNGQITNKPEPNAVLDALISNHVLMRAGDTPGISFQHQQFQEWYASHYVERRIIAEVVDPKGREALKADIFNYPIWEEAILFAVERMSRGSEHHRVACGKAILAAFEVEPLLAAEMIFRSTEHVWALISTAIQKLIARWHASGKVDRAFRFMLTSGRPEFLDAVWPLITDEKEQVSLKALRNCKQFRPSILGAEATKKIKALPKRPRLVLLHEMASNSGIDGLLLATSIAKEDPEPEVKASVLDALAFRHADRHAIEILKGADDKTFDLVCRQGLVDHLENKDVQAGLDAARKRLAPEISVYDRLGFIVYAQDAKDYSAELTQIISTMEIDPKRDARMQFVYEARNRYPHAVAQGILVRLRAGRELFYSSDDMLASAGIVIEDEVLLNLVLADPVVDQSRADAAASVLGAKSVGEIVDALLKIAPYIRADAKASESYTWLEQRIVHVPGASLVAAVIERSPNLDNEQMARLAALLSRRPEGDNDRSRPYDAKAIRAIQKLIQDWGKRLLASSDAKRWHKAKVATLASHVPAVELLPLLKDMLDDNLKRYRDFRVQAEAANWQPCEAVHEARQPCTTEYQWAFLAIKSQETAALMREYLEDEHFGSLAARVLVNQWIDANELPKDKRFLGGVDFSDVKAKRAARASDPKATCEAAEAIFTAIDRLTAEGATKKQQMLAVALGVTALRLPHGQRDATIRKIVSLAPRKAYETVRADLLLNLVLSGDELDIADVTTGINDTLEAAKTDWGILHQSDGYQLKVWLRLLPFVNKPLEVLPVILGLPDAQRDPRSLREMIRAFSHAPSEEAEEALFNLAQSDPRFYDEYEWRESVIRRGTASSARRLIDLVASGVLGKKSSADDWHFQRQLAALISKYPDLRAFIYGLLKDDASAHGMRLLAGAIAESPDEEGVLWLVKCDGKKQSFLDGRAIEKAVTEHVPVDGYQNAYNVLPVLAVELKRKLFAMTTDGGPEDGAARWLRQIDNIRDEYGLPEGEPRHPDLSSGKSWPIIKPDPDASED